MVYPLEDDTVYSLAVGTVIWSSIGPIPNDMVLEVSASLLRPSVTHFLNVAIFTRDIELNISVY